MAGTLGEKMGLMRRAEGVNSQKYPELMAWTLGEVDRIDGEGRGS